MNCEKCSAPIPENDGYEHADRVLCEDCYIDIISTPRTCDPWAVYAATRTKSKEESLPAHLQRILDLITKKGPISLERICADLAVGEQEFRNSFSTLRHMELAKACKNDGQVLYIPFTRTTK